MEIAKFQTPVLLEIQAVEETEEVLGLSPESLQVVGIAQSQVSIVGYGTISFYEGLTLNFDPGFSGALFHIIVGSFKGALLCIGTGKIDCVQPLSFIPENNCHIQTTAEDGKHPYSQTDVRALVHPFSIDELREHILGREDDSTICLSGLHRLRRYHRMGGA